MTSPQASYRLPPGPKEPTALGIDPQTLQTLQELQQQYGDMVSLTQPNGRLAYFINDAAEVQRILAGAMRSTVKGQVLSA